MNLRDLKYVVAVAETRHFGRAAQACFVSQPTLSGQIKKLEDELGVVIFERTNKRVALTVVGADIVASARRVLEQADTLVQIAQAHQDPLAGPMRLGVIPTLGPYLTPLMIRPLRERYPQMQLVLSEELTVDLVSRLQRHAIDAALIATPLDEPEGMVQRPLFAEPFWLAHPREDPIYTVDDITRAELSKLRLLVLADAHCLSAQVREVCDMAGASAGLEDFRAASLETLLQLVSAGIGSTLVPALAVRGGWTTDMGIVARPLALEGAERQVNLVHRASFPRPEAIDALVELIDDRLPNTVTSLVTHG